MRVDAQISVSQVAHHFGVSRRTVTETVRRFQETNDVEDRQRSGRPRGTNAEDDNFLVTETRSAPFITSSQLVDRLEHNRGIRVTSQTVRNRLASAGLRSYHPARFPRLTDFHRELRYQFAEEHLQWTPEQWKRVVWTDETRFTLRNANGRTRVWRYPREERHIDRFSVESERSGRVSIMMWAAICWGGKSAIVFVDGTLTGAYYLHDILQPVGIPFAQQAVGQNFLWMDDNARPHRAAIVSNWMRNNGVQCIEWPPYSPDMNPIEHAWDELGRAVMRRTPPPSNLEELRYAIAVEWDALPMRKIRRLLSSMRSRCDSVINAAGGGTRY